MEVVMELISNITTEECVGWFTEKVHTEKIKTTHFHFQKNTSSQRSAGRMFCCKSLRTYMYLNVRHLKKFNRRTSNVTQIFRQSNFTATRDARHFTIHTSHFTSHSGEVKYRAKLQEGVSATWSDFFPVMMP